MKKKLSNNAKRQINSLIEEAKRFYLVNQPGSAKERCNKILEFDESEPNACNLLGKIAERNGNTDEAMALYTRSLKLHPTHPGLIASIALLSGKLGDGETAIRNWLKLVKLKPSSPDAWQGLSAQWSDMRQWVLAAKAGARASSLAPNRAPLYANMGRILRHVLRHDDAITNMKKAAELAPDDLQICFDLAVLTLENGDIDESFNLFQKLHTLDPNHAESIGMQLLYKKVTSHNDLMTRAEEIHDAPTTPEHEKGLLAFALGKAWEDMDEFDKSFDYYEEGNQIFHNLSKFDIEERRDFAKQMKSVFSKDFLASNPGNESTGSELLFIVGMPRSGSTLLDVILSAHPGVVDMGESDTLKHLTGSLTSGDCNIITPEKLPELPDEQIKAAAAEYIETAHNFFGDSERYIDKALTNFWLIGFIRVLFPNARILHVSRDPMDTCFSIFSRQFSGHDFNFAYDFGDIAEYYQLYQEMMAHWSSVVPTENLCEIKYEELVASPEEETRRLLEFCGLPWDEACLNFHEAGGAVQTVSLAQVRQPIYSSSVGRWKRYEKQLQPLIDALGNN